MTQKQVCRVGDTGTGTCYAHASPTAFTTTFTTGATFATADGRQICVVGSLGTTSCGHTTRATTGSGITGFNGQQIHRVGDVGVVVEDNRGTYTATTGSPTVTSE